MTASRATQTQVWLVIAAALLSGGSPRRLDAQASPLDAGANPSTDQADPRIAQLHALREGKLAPEVEPSTLFDLSLTDQAAIEVEAARLRLLLSATERAQRPEPPDAAGPARTLWDSRLALDRARLEFYSLSEGRRAVLLREHRARREVARALESETEQQARRDAVERQVTLEAARTARSEADRAIAEEQAQLNVLDEQLARLTSKLAEQRETLRANREEILGWQRRVREAKSAGAANSDETYDALRVALRRARDELANALDVLDEGRSEVPKLPPTKVSQVPADVPLEQVQTLRARLAQQIVRVNELERQAQRERGAILLDEVVTLNHERLALLPFLSNEKREATTGFTAAAWHQAQAEARHLALLLRYERHVTQAFIAAWRSGDSVRSRPSSWSIVFVVVPWLALIAAFVWQHRRSAVWLRYADSRIATLDRAERRTTPSPQRRVVRLLLSLRTPIEWGLFFGASWWLLPSSARELLELQLLSTILLWIIGMSFVVNTIDALAGSKSATAWHEEDQALSALRLRSLRLVGRAVVVLALILMLSRRLVGQGTIYSWTWSACWLVSVPVFLVLVRWWRAVVFERVERGRKKSSLQTWALSRRSGWQSFLGAVLVAVQLFATGAFKVVRGWLSEFDLARRAHAYLFKRELERLDDSSNEAVREPLADSVIDALDPEAPYSSWISCSNDDLLDELVACAARRDGGLRALVAARGMGKTSLVRALEARVPGALIVRCESATRPMDVLRMAAAAGHPPAILLDDAHALAKPVIGGFALFDEMIALCREHCQQTLWLWTLDSALWPLLKRARDARPLFDKTHLLSPWDETQIGALLRDRCQRADIMPVYDDLIDKLPPGSDELDRQDALHAKQVGYERMLWDHVRGNPALALEAWRASLACDRLGVVHVRPLQGPDSSSLETLPDPALFVLRAVLQLAPAAVDEVALATRQSPDQIRNVLRFGKPLGMFTEQDGRVLVSWAWLRAVTRALERRHLLVNS